jgi:hypothetical protein
LRTARMAGTTFFPGLRHDKKSSVRQVHHRISIPGKHVKTQPREGQGPQMSLMRTIFVSDIDTSRNKGTLHWHSIMHNRVYDNIT